jgi:hypothetical protein
MFKLSIITPTYKRSRDLIKNYNFLKKNVNFYNFEWILLYEIDDYKTVATINTINDKFVKKYPGYYKSADKATIFGIKKSTGYFIVLHPDDDFFTKDFFFTIRKVSASLEWIIGGGFYINKKNKISQKYITLVKSMLLKNYSSHILRIINFLMGASIIFKKIIFQKLGGIPKINYAGADYFLWLKFDKFYQPKIINKNFSFSRFDENTITGSFDIKRYVMRLKVLKSYANNFLVRLLQYLIIISIIIFNFINKVILKKY